MTEQPDSDGPLVVRVIAEIITYTIYLSWLSVIAAGALYLGLPPLTAIRDAAAVPWQGTAAAIAAGALSLVVLRLVFDALRGRQPQRAEPAAALEAEAAPVPDPTAQKRTKKKKKRRRSRKR